MPFSPQDQHIGVGGRRAFDQLADALHCLRAPDQTVLGDRGVDLGRAPAFQLCLLAAPAECGGAVHRRGEPLVAPGLGHEVARAPLQRLDRNRDRAVGRDNDDGRLAVDGGDPANAIQPFVPVSRATFEIQVEQDGVRLLGAEHVQERIRRAHRLDAREHVPQRQARRQGDVGIVVHHHGKIIARRHRATVVARVSKSEQPAFSSNWHGSCSKLGMTSLIYILQFKRQPDRCDGALSIFAHQLIGFGQ